MPISSSPSSPCGSSSFVFPELGWTSTFPGSLWSSWFPVAAWSWSTIQGGLVPISSPSPSSPCGSSPFVSPKLGWTSTFPAGVFFSWFSVAAWPPWFSASGWFWSTIIGGLMPISSSPCDVWSFVFTELGGSFELTTSWGSIGCDIKGSDCKVEFWVSLSISPSFGCCSSSALICSSSIIQGGSHSIFSASWGGDSTWFPVSWLSFVFCASNSSTSTIQGGLVPIDSSSWCISGPSTSISLFWDSDFPSSDEVVSCFSWCSICEVVVPELDVVVEVVTVEVVVVVVETGEDVIVFSVTLFVVTVVALFCAARGSVHFTRRWIFPPFLTFLNGCKSYHLSVSSVNEAAGISIFDISLSLTNLLSSITVIIKFISLRFPIEKWNSSFQTGLRFPLITFVCFLIPNWTVQ